VGKSGLEGKSFQIPKQLVGEAYRRVRVNKGAAGVDRQSMADFDEDLGNNLYWIWNRVAIQPESGPLRAREFAR
jgi:hypothetical protein